jgi:hypothetical protein
VRQKRAEIETLGTSRAQQVRVGRRDRRDRARPAPVHVDELPGRPRLHRGRPGEFRDEIEHFFQVYKDLQAKKTETHGSGNRDEAERVIEEARERSATARSTLWL